MYRGECGLHAVGAFGRPADFPSGCTLAQSARLAVAGLAGAPRSPPAVWPPPPPLPPQHVTECQYFANGKYLLIANYLRVCRHFN